MVRTKTASIPVKYRKPQIYELNELSSFCLYNSGSDSGALNS